MRSGVGSLLGCSGESPLAGLHTASSCCVLMGQSRRQSTNSLVPLLTRTLVLLGLPSGLH